MGGPTADDFDATLAELLAGDEDAFRHAYRSLNPGLVRYLTVLVGAGDAEDVASETWAQVCRDLPKFRGDGDGFRGWVGTIGRHRAMDHLRAVRRRPQQSGTSEAVLVERPSRDEVDTDALTAISTQDALALIRTLPQEQAEAVLLRVVMGLDAKAAGRVLGKRAGAVRTAAFRGLRTLGANLDNTARLNDTAPPDNPSRTADSDIFRALVAEELS
jgi:RNA polymerase sigma-70 factor, ECF subfamily